MGKVVTAPINAARTTVSMTCVATVLAPQILVSVVTSPVLLEAAQQFTTDKIRTTNVQSTAGGMQREHLAMGSKLVIGHKAVPAQPIQQAQPNVKIVSVLTAYVATAPAPIHVSSATTAREFAKPF